MRALACFASFLALLLAFTGAGRTEQMQQPRPIIVAEGEAAPAAAADADSDDKDQDTPEDKMEARFPQPVRVGFLIGLPLLDYGDSTIGFIQNVVRTPEEKIQLIVGIGGWFGYWPKRSVAVPIEAVAILARQVDALDLSRAQIETAPTWDPSKGQAIDPSETIRIALARR